MKIVVDARMYGLEHAGIGRYVMNLIHQFKVQSSKFKGLDLCLLVRKNKLTEIKKEVGEKFEAVVADCPHYSLKEQIFLPLQLFKLRPDLVHFPHFNVPIFWFGKYVVTIHDLIKHESKGPRTTTRWQLFYWLKYLAYRVVVWLAIKRAVKVIVPSWWWKKELIRRYQLVPEKVAVTHEGAGEKFKVKSEKLKFKETLEKYRIKKPFIIYTGSLYPHKNVERLVEAVKLIKLTLVIVCSRNVFYERFKKKVKQMGAEKYVNLVGFVPDEELTEIYKEAEVFVFPSLLEGFGLPGLEAMAVGLPVVCSDIPVFREVYGKAAVFFNPLDVKDMAQKIKAVCFNDLNHRNKIIKRGFEQVKKYSWEKMGKETVAIYKDAVE